MNASISPVIPGQTKLRTCWALFVVWQVSLLWSSLSPTTPSGMVAAGLQFLALIVLVLLHASLEGGWRAALGFVAVLCATSLAVEGLSIATGFPFGFFEHHSPGPRVFGVPLVVATGYAVYGWLAWSQTLTVMRAAPGASRRLYWFAGPLIASMVLVGYDYPWDAIGSTVLGIHSYREPSGLFGVPLSNFLGWIVTGWLAFQIVVLVWPRWSTQPARWRAGAYLAPLIYLGMALGYFLRFWVAPAEVVSAGAQTFNARDIYEASAAIGLPALVLPALITLVAALATPPASSQQ